MTFQAEPHSIVVNRHGQRFVSENDFNIGEALDARDEKGEPFICPAISSAITASSAPRCPSAGTPPMSGTG